MNFALRFGWRELNSIIDDAMQIKTQGYMCGRSCTSFTLVLFCSLLIEFFGFIFQSVCLSCNFSWHIPVSVCQSRELFEDIFYYFKYKSLFNRVHIPVLNLLIKSNFISRNIDRCVGRSICLTIYPTIRSTTQLCWIIYAFG